MVSLLKKNQHTEHLDQKKVLNPSKVTSFTQDQMVSNTL